MRVCLRTRHRSETLYYRMWAGLHTRCLAPTLQGRDRTPSPRRVEPRANCGLKGTRSRSLWSGSHSHARVVSLIYILCVRNTQDIVFLCTSLRLDFLFFTPLFSFVRHIVLVFHLSHRASFVSRSWKGTLPRASTKRQGRSAGKLRVRARVPARTHPRPFSILHPSRPDSISRAPLRVTDQGDANQNSSPTPPSTTILAHLGPHTATLHLSRRPAAQPLASIDYSINILSTPAVPACQRFATACQPQLLTPAQAALAYALGTVQGRAHPTP